MSLSPVEADRFNDRLFMTAVLLALPPLATIVVASVLYYLGWLALIVSLAVSYAAVYGLFFLKRREAGPVLISLALTAGSLLAASLFYDISVDGRIHLQESVIQLAKGWNPTESGVPAPRPWWGTEWINYYPAGLQIIGAAFYKLTGNLQAAKGYNFIFMSAAAAAAWSVLRSVTSPRLSGLLTLALIGNPVVVSQLWTFYIDGTIYLIFLIALCLLIQVTPGFYFNDERKARDPRGQLILATALASILVLPVVKVSCFAFAAFLYLLLVYQLRSRRKLVVSLSVLGILLFYIVGYKPYFMYFLHEITGRVRLANPLPIGITGHHPVISQILNYFGTPAATYEVSSVVFFSTDFEVRFNASGGLYGVIFGFFWLWSLAYLLKLVIKDRLSGTNRFFIFLFAVTNLVPILYPMFINQRYYPIQYIFPIAMLARYCLSSGRAGTVLATVMAGAVLINPLGVLADTVVRNVLYTSYTNESLSRLAAKPHLPYRQVSVDDDLSAFRPAWLEEPEPGQSQADYYVSLVSRMGDDLSAFRLSRMLSNRFFFKDLGESIYMPTLEPNWFTARKRFNDGQPSSSRVSLNNDGLMLIIERDDAGLTSGGRAEIVKLDLEVPEGHNEIMMYLQDDRSEAFSLDFDRYFRWSIYTLRPGYFVDIPPYARRALIVPGRYMKIKQAEIRDVDFPETISPEELSRP